jgi:hypothetical protein
MCVCVSKQFSLYSDFPTTMMYVSLMSYMSAACPAHRILYGLITLILSGEEWT